MKSKSPKTKLALICSLFLFQTFAAAQKGFILSGHLRNYGAKNLIFFYRDSTAGFSYAIEPILVDSSGTFHLSSNKVDRAMMGTLRGPNINMQIFVAPGYALEISADGSSFESFQLTKKIAGAGSYPNLYLLALDSMEQSFAKAKPWVEMDKNELIQFIKSSELRKMNIYKKFFGQRNSSDFKAIALRDIRTLSLYYLVDFLIRDSSFNYAESNSFLSQNASSTMLANLFAPNNLISENYISWLMGSYNKYELKLQYLKKNIPFPSDIPIDSLLEITSRTYKGKIRDLKLAELIERAVAVSGSFEELQKTTNAVEPYLESIKPDPRRLMLDSLLRSSQSKLAETVLGKPAPGLLGTDSSGAIKSLADFKGKIVYVDFWASWCVPCRKEIPFLQALASRYANDTNIVFLSVGVMDKKESWKNAVQKDNPSWVQLFDNNGSVQKNYFLKAIPKYIIIDRKGNLISFNASYPSNPNVETELQNALDISKESTFQLK